MTITQDPLRNQQETVQLDDDTVIVLWYQQDDDAPGRGWYSSPTDAQEPNSPVWEMQKLGPFTSREEAINAARHQSQENSQ